jgi:hypothetical protein
MDTSNIMFHVPGRAVLLLCAVCVPWVNAVQLVLDAGTDNDASSYAAVVAGGVNTGPGLGTFYSTAGEPSDQKFLEQMQVNFGATSVVLNLVFLVGLISR